MTLEQLKRAYELGATRYAVAAEEKLLITSIAGVMFAYMDNEWKVMSNENKAFIEQHCQVKDIDFSPLDGD